MVPFTQQMLEEWSSMRVTDTYKFLPRPSETPFSQARLSSNVTNLFENLPSHSALAITSVFRHLGLVGMTS